MLSAISAARPIEIYTNKIRFHERLTKMDLFTPGNEVVAPMNTSISSKLVVGVGMIPHSVRMRARGYVRVSNSNPFTNPWKHSSVVEMEKRAVAKAAAHREHVAHYGEVEKALKSVCENIGFLQLLEDSWGDMAVPEVRDVCRPLPAGRMTPPQFRAWVLEGQNLCKTPEEVRKYLKHTDQLRMDYYAKLPDCVFAAAVKQEPNAVGLRAYRAGEPERQRIAKIKEEIDLATALKAEYEENPSVYFRTTREQEEEIAALSAEIAKLYASIGGKREWVNAVAHK